MKTMRFFLVAVLLLLLAGGSRAAFCQTQQTLSDFLKSNLPPKPPLIVLEGDRYVDRERQELLRILAGNAGLREKIIAVAEKCDYEVKEYGSGVNSVSGSGGAYLFYKKYSRDEELPCVTGEELIRYSEDISRILGQLHGEARTPSSTPYIHDLLLSLSDADWNQVQQGVLPVNTLDPKSRQLFTALLTQTFVGSLQHFCRIMNQYGAGADRSRLEVAKDQFSNPFIQCRFYVNGMPGEAHSFRRESNDLYVAQSVADEYKYLNASFSGSTLGDVIGRLDPENKATTEFKADASLMNKPVSIVGWEAAAASPLRVFECVARLYDLRLRVTSKALTLSRNPVQLKSNGDPGRDMIAALPYPLRRTLGKRNHEGPAAKYIYTLLPKLQKTKSQSLPVRELSRLHRAAITLYFFNGALREVRDNDMARLPGYLNNTEALYLRCRRTPGSPIPLSFTILTDKNGKLVEGPDYMTSQDVPRD